MIDKQQNETKQTFDILLPNVYVAEFANFQLISFQMTQVKFLIGKLKCDEDGNSDDEDSDDKISDYEISVNPARICNKYFSEKWT